MLLATFFIFCACWLHVRAEIVSTKYGDIEGLVTSYPNASGPFKSVSKFLGVPFSAPPTGELRFKAPQPPKEWKPKVYSAKTHGSVCLQPKLFENLIEAFTSNFTFSEDCLYLDIYSPNISLSLPVMVYIHGGGYLMGTAIIFPSDILALQGVVVVIIQYRLGPFGFLTTGDSAAPGNYGMLDQVEALKWVKENIENFGGNPSKVTIFGESAGGTSVGLHLLSPLSRDLFHQAIPESGVDLSPFAIQPTSFGLRFTKELARKLNCGSSDHSAMVSCMRRKTASDMQRAAESIKFGFVNYIYWAPVVDKNFLHDTPQVLRKKGEFKQVPLIITFTSNEGATFLGDMVNNSLGLMESVDNGVSPTLFKSFLTKFAQVQNSRKKNADLLADALEFMYTPWPDNSNTYALRSGLVDVIGDNLFVAPSHKVADVHGQVAPVYLYEFAHRGKSSLVVRAEWMGVVHAENIPFDFGVPFLPKFSPHYSQADRNVSLFIMTMYANFARSGDPSVSGVTWEKYNSSHRAYLKVDTSPKLKASFNSRRMSFWNNYYPKLKQVKFDVNKEVVSGAKDVVTIGTALQVVFALIVYLIY
ncbi:neuroligin-4, X-linked-like [Porites lutea]|uniref:neuroligin-4, X-linked-like n=1 Tax=Porites lutea TaxID=51062 RepID=UPI003CC52AE0